MKFKLTICLLLAAVATLVFAAVESSSVNSAASRLTTMTSGGGAGVKGAYTELIASTARESYWVTVTLQGASGTKENYHVYLAVGAAASEVDKLEFTYWSGSGTQVDTFTVPLTIASGARVSAACNSSGTSVNLGIKVDLSDEDAFGTSTQNFLTDTTGGTSGYQGIDVDPGGTINTEGSWTQLEASTPSDADYIIVSIGMSANPTLLGGDWLIDIGTGAAASETAIVSDIAHFANASEEGNTYFPVFVNIPAGTRISARCQSSQNDAADRIIDVSIIAINMTAPAGVGGGEHSATFVQ